MVTVWSCKDSTTPQYQKAQVQFLETMQVYGQIQEEAWYLKNNLELN